MARLLVLALAVLALVAAGCGGEEAAPPEPETVEGTVPAETGGGEDGGADGEAEGDPEAGADVFASAGCGSCHVFEDAGSTGTVGPNLDESDASFEAAVEQIANGGGGMPPFQGQLSEQEIADVAAYVTQSR